MHRVVGPALALCVAALAALPLAAVDAAHRPAHGAVALRYHFTTGERYAYHVTLTMNASTSGAGAPPSAGNVAVTLSGVLGFHVLRVDASGGAYAETSTSGMTMRMITNGRTVTSTVAQQPSTTVYLGADGSQRGTESGGFSAYGTPAIGSLPSDPVAPGAHWSSTALTSMPSTLGASFAPMRLTAQNVFSRYSMVSGERAAVIDSTGALQYSTDTTIDRVPVHMHITGSTSGQSLFGTVTGRQLSSRVHMDMRMFMAAHGTVSNSTAVREHLVMSLSMDPLTS